MRQPEEEQNPTAPSLGQHARALGGIIRRETEMMDRRQPPPAPNRRQVADSDAL